MGNLAGLCLRLDGLQYHGFHGWRRVLISRLPLHEFAPHAWAGHSSSGKSRGSFAYPLLLAHQPARSPHDWALRQIGLRRTVNRFPAPGNRTLAMLMRVATSYGSQSAQVGAAIRFVLCYCRAFTGSALIPKLRAFP